MKAWTSDSAAKHIAVLKERGNNNNKINVFQGHWDHASLGNSHAGTHPDGEEHSPEKLNEISIFFPFLITSASAGLVDSLLAYFSKDHYCPSFQSLPQLL